MVTVATQQNPSQQLQTIMQPQAINPVTQLAQQAQEMRFVSSAAAQRAELAAHEIAALNSAYNDSPKPGGSAKGVALAGVGAGLGYIGSKKAIDFAAHFKNEHHAVEELLNSVKERSENGEILNVNKVIGDLGKIAGKDTKLKEFIVNSVAEPVKTVQESVQQAFEAEWINANNAALKDKVMNVVVSHLTSPDKIDVTEALKELDKIGGVDASLKEQIIDALTSAKDAANISLFNEHAHNIFAKLSEIKNIEYPDTLTGKISGFLGNLFAGKSDYDKIIELVEKQFSGNEEAKEAVLKACHEIKDFADKQGVPFEDLQDYQHIFNIQENTLKKVGDVVSIFGNVQDTVYNGINSVESSLPEDVVVANVGEIAQEKFQNVVAEISEKNHQNIGGAVNNIRDFVTDKIDEDTLGKVGSAVVAVCALTGAVLGVRHVMKENEQRMSRLEAIDQAIQQTSAEQQMLTQTAINNAIGAGQAETMLASAWQQRMADRGIAPREQDASWVERTSQQPNTQTLVSNVAV